MFGLFDPGNYILVDYAIELYKKRSKKKIDLSVGFKDTFGQECKPHFVGVWDTVSSVGWIFSPLNLPFTHKNPDIIIGRHALAIDERRAFFRQNSWIKAFPEQNLKELWFAGVHSDVGGGYPENESGLSKIAFEWMISEAKNAGLLIDERLYRDLLGGNAEFTKPDPHAPAHESLSGWWKLAELIPRRRWHPALKRERWMVPFFGHRYVPKDSECHPSVGERRSRAENNYSPRNLPPF
jgi:hypothetical protein